MNKNACHNFTPTQWGDFVTPITFDAYTKSEFGRVALEQLMV